jgi:sugar O-acyltransferase (sialic acid O-acetyltransferase NeuD family)|tara:strand:- start:1906 stop:2550 length:645 start_codon:yes stop_codon:yes gene_type:complete
MKKKILIFSAGSAGREVFQLILSINKLQNEWEVIGYVDDDISKIGKTIDNIEVYSNKNKPKKKEIYATCGIMDNNIRKKIFDEEIIKNSYQLTNLVHPLVEKPKCFTIGLGNIIFGNVHISFEVNINNFSIISNFCDLGHNLISGNCITVMPGVTIGGNCNIGAHTLIGSGSIIYQGTRIGENCKIGMGTLITNNLKNNSVVVDQPRKIVRNVE